MMPASEEEAIAPCASDDNEDVRTIPTSGRIIPVNVARAAPATCPSEAANQTCRCPARSGIVLMSTDLESIRLEFLPSSSINMPPDSRNRCRRLDFSAPG